MRTKHLTVFVFFLLALATAVTAAPNITSPANNSVFYTTYIDVELQWDAGQPCYYMFNGQESTNNTFVCQSEFRVAAPYMDGQVNLTVMQPTGRSNVTVTIDNAPTAVEGWIVGVLLLIPMLFIFFFLTWGFVLDAKDHAPMKIFSYLLAWTWLFVQYWAVDLVIGEYLYFPLLREVFSTWWFGWIYYTVLAYFFLYIIYTIFNHFKLKGEERKMFRITGRGRK